MNRLHLRLPLRVGVDNCVKATNFLPYSLAYFSAVGAFIAMNCCTFGDCQVTGFIPRIAEFTNFAILFGKVIF